jgi:hypothetical protein
VAAARRDLVCLLYVSVFFICYILDALSILSTGRSLIVLSEGLQDIPSGLLSRPLVFVVLASVCGLIVTIGLSGRSRASSLRLRPGSVRLGVASLCLGLALGYLASRLSSVSLQDVLSSRQDFLGSQLLLLVVYNALPMLCLLLLLEAFQANGLRRYYAASLALMGTLGVAATGSRSALMLSLIAPFLIFLWKLNAVRVKTVARDIRRLFLLLIGGSATLLLLTVYLSVARSVGAQRGFLTGPDVTQFDVLVRLMDWKGPTSFSYLAAATFYVPRSLWSAKQLPGNVVTSLALTPGRYQLTGAETTSGLLGEAWINGRWLGFIVAIGLVVLLLWWVRKLISSESPALWLLGCVVALRGVNILRGDLTNVVVPLAGAALVTLLVNRKAWIHE